VWVPKPYKSYKGFKWVWVEEQPNEIHIDSTALNKPKAYCSEYAREKGKRISTRQYRNNPKSALYVYTPQGSYFTILNKRVESVKKQDAIKFLKYLGINPEEVYADSRFGTEFKLLEKRKSIPEKRFGYKRGIHQLPKNTPQELVEVIHIQYLKRKAKMVRLE